MEPKVLVLENDMAHTFNNAVLETSTKKIKFKAKDPANDKEVDLSSIIPVVPPVAKQTISVADNNGVISSAVEVLKFDDGLNIVMDSAASKPTVSIRNPGPWTKLGSVGNYYPVKNFHFTGNVGSSSASGGTLTLKIPDDPTPTTASIGTGEVKTINKIELIGETAGSLFDGNTLKINLPTGGGGGPIDPTALNQNFKGFFPSLGDLLSEVTDAISGKSFAFVKDSKYGNLYYTPMFYVNGNWTELKQDPAILYQPVGEANSQGVFSIKPDSKITIDSNGQLDLSALGVQDISQVNFHGFYNNMDALVAAVPNPVEDRSFAYVTASGASNNMLLGRAYRRDATTGQLGWKIVAPMSSLGFVTKQAGTDVSIPLFGFHNNDMVSMDHNGIVTIKEHVDTSVTVKVTDKDGVENVGQITEMDFKRSKSLVTLDKASKKITLEHPQRVVEYTDTFESNHNSIDYRGSIFYDENRKLWIGWADPRAPGAVDRKWTPIAHEGMSTEVTGLTARNPAKIPTTTPSGDGESRNWDYSGVTYLERQDTNLPDELITECGGFVRTLVKYKESEPNNIDVRTQTCHADDGSGRTFSRSYDAASTSTGSKWNPWVRISFSKKDINAHEEDPAAHKKIIKYHRATSFSCKYTELITQQGVDGSSGFVRDSNCGLLVDNYGFEGGNDFISFPYEGTFRVRGELAFSGFDGSTIPVTTWSVTLMVERKRDPGNVTLLRTFTYNHTKKDTKYPPIFFEQDRINIESGDKIYVKIKSSDQSAITTAQPALYFVPIKSFLVIEDVETRSGTFIAKTHKDQLANLNAFGDIEVKAHYRKYDGAGAVRLYGEAVIKNATEMK